MTAPASPDRPGRKRSTFSPHIHIGEELDLFEHPSTPISWALMVQRLIDEMTAGGRITTEESHYYCKRLDAITARRKESA